MKFGPGLSAMVFAPVLALGAAGAALAHHSAVAQFEAEKTIVLQGALSKVAWGNPHVEFMVSDIRDGSSWRFETRPPGYFVQAGLSKKDLENLVGRTVSVTARPAKDGGRYGWAVRLRFSDVDLNLPAQ